MFKTAYKYQCVDSLKAIVVYYIVILTLYLTMLISTSNMSGSSSIGGMEMATAIFLFVVGLNAFKEPFLFQMQNGVSRRTIWMGMGALAVTLAVGMSVIDTVLYLAMKYLQDQVVVESMSDQVFFQLLQQESGMRLDIQLVFTGAVYLFSIGLGYMISMMYYRMNAVMKTVVSVGVPGMLFVGFPLIERFITMGKLTELLTWVLKHTFGRYPSPYRWSLWLFIFAVLMFGICYLLIRRAIVRK